jgi:hypothetical protein
MTTGQRNRIISSKFQFTMFRMRLPCLRFPHPVRDSRVSGGSWVIEASWERTNVGVVIVLLSAPIQNRTLDDKYWFHRRVLQTSGWPLLELMLKEISPSSAGPFDAQSWEQLRFVRSRRGLAFDSTSASDDSVTSSSHYA